MKNNLWRRIPLQTDESEAYKVQVQFLASVEGEAITLHRKFRIYGSTLDMADCAASVMEKPRLSGVRWDQILVEGQYQGTHILVLVYNSRREVWHSKDKEISPIEVHATGHRKAVTAVLSHMERSFDKLNVAEIRWWYTDEGRTSAKTVYLPQPTSKLHPELYPDLASPEGFLKAYMESDAVILLIAGPPGTGKTTLLRRHLIWEHKLSAHVTYDEILMNKDSIFQSFLFDDDSDVLIIEDADTILASRENDKNKMMARFLNVSDGLIKFPTKKLVFTTNISDFGKVDSALIRPGRCFAVLHTRPLTLPEAQAAAKVANLPVPTERREYTLAELFNQGAAPRAVRRIGIVG